MKKTWKGHLTVVLVVAMMLTMALPAFAVEVEEENLEDIAEDNALNVKNPCPFCGEEIWEYVGYTSYTDNGDSGHTVTELIRGEHCGRTFYERVGTPRSESHSNGSEILVEISHLSTVPRSEHYAIYEWRCEDCNHITQGEPQSTGCANGRCNR